MNLGDIYKELGNINQALTSTLKSVELSPNNATAYVNLGGIYKELGELNKALDSTLKALAIKPNNFTGHMNLGSIYKELGQLDQARASTLKSIELKPDNPDSISNFLGVCEEGDFRILKDSIRKTAERNKGILNNLKFIEIISSLGEEYAQEIYSLGSLNN